MGRQTTTYPSEEQRERWSVMAERCGMSLSEFIEAMVEGGMKRFDPRINQDEANAALREQRNNARKELEDARRRIEKLENKLDNDEREEVRNQIKKSPGITYNELVETVGYSVPQRVQDHLEAMRAFEIEKRDDGFYYVGESDE
jgi:molecular chaperone DnaK (HSP70)